MVKYIVIIFSFVIGLSKDSKNIMDKFVYNHLLLTKSKMESSPMVWQDVKEGYLRNFTVRYTDVLLDSMDQGALTSYQVGIRHFQKIDSLRIEINKGEEYKYLIKPKIIPQYNVNYFPSSIE